MIIAPLKDPIDTLSYGLVRLEGKLIRRSLWTLCTGIVLTVLVAYLLAMTIGSRFAGSEIYGRVNPNLLDLGVALAARAAGAFSLTRLNISGAPAGVAIAVALVPPLCVVGIGVAVGEKLSAAHDPSLGEIYMAKGAGLLFLTNLVAIAFSGAVVFLVQSCSSVKRATVGLMISIACISVLTLPLGFSLREMLLPNRVHSLIKRTVLHEFPEWYRDIHTISADISIRNKIVFAKFFTTAPEDLIAPEYIERIQNHLSSRINRPVELRVNILPYKTMVVPAELPPSSTSEVETE